MLFVFIDGRRGRFLIENCEVLSLVARSHSQSEQLFDKDEAAQFEGNSGN
jgi:hypothetical protein